MPRTRSGWPTTSSSRCRRAPISSARCTRPSRRTSTACARWPRSRPTTSCGAPTTRIATGRGRSRRRRSRRSSAGSIRRSSERCSGRTCGGSTASPDMEVRFWGTRGSIATPGPHTVRFGGNTSCVEVRTDAGHVFILDCGTGARPLGDTLTAPTAAPVRASLLFSHTHWDHIQGFPFFAPAFEPRHTIAIYGPRDGRRSLRDALARQMELSYFPVEMSQLPATLSYTDLGEGAHTIGGARIVAQYLNHPAVTLGYRVEADGAAVVYACDHEPFGGALWRGDAAAGPLESILHEGDRRHARFLADADLVIHDAQYTPEEYRSRKNWGHSTFEYVVELACSVGVKRLALTHHDPSHDDAAVAVAERRRARVEVFCAFEGARVRVEAGGVGRTDAPETAHAPTTAIAPGARI